MNDTAKSMVLASFAADALSLGVHWIYNVNKIRDIYGRVEGYIKPMKGSYHEGKDAGDFTHYGDQTLVLLESLAECGGFDADDFSKRWRTLFEGYKGYVDGATRGALQNISNGLEPIKAGSASNDLAGASRIAPVIYVYKNDEDAMVYAARTQTRMTHNHPRVIDAAEFFARVAFKVLHDTAPVQAIRELKKERWRDTQIGEWVENGLAALGMTPEKTIKQFGQSCHIPEAFPAVIHLIGKYENNLNEALIENVMAGGDSAARGMIVGMVLGAHSGKNNLREEWVKDLKRRKIITGLLEKLDTQH